MLNFLGTSTGFLITLPNFLRSHPILKKRFTPCSPCEKKTLLRTLRLFPSLSFKEALLVFLRASIHLADSHRVSQIFVFGGVKGPRRLHLVSGDPAGSHDWCWNVSRPDLLFWLQKSEPEKLPVQHWKPEMSPNFSTSMGNNFGDFSGLLKHDLHFHGLTSLNWGVSTPYFQILLSGHRIWGHWTQLLQTLRRSKCCNG